MKSNVILVLVLVYKITIDERAIVRSRIQSSSSQPKGKQKKKKETFK